MASLDSRPSGSEERVLRSRESRLGSAESRLGSGESRLGSGESRLGSGESRLGSGESRLGSGESRLGSGESRLGSAESRLGSGESRLGSGESRLGSGESRLGSGESRLGSGESRLGSGESRLGSAESRVSRLGSGESRLGSAESRSGSGESRLGSEESRLGSGESRLGPGESRESRLGSGESREGSGESRESRLGSGESRLGSGESRLGSGESRLGSGESRLGSGESRLGSGESRLGSGESRLGSGESRLGSGESRLGSGESRLGSGESRLGSGESRLGSGESRLGFRQSRSESTESRLSSWESELTPVQHSLKFVSTLKDEFVCPVCRGVVLNPQQNSCGHIYCFLCLHGLLESSSTSSPVCPVDGAVITPAEVFQDNCCKREISSLDVYCTNSPECTSVVTLRHLQTHLRLCPYERVRCSNAGCRAVLPRRRLAEHVGGACLHRAAPCPHCQRPHPLSLMQDHVNNLCLEVEVKCPNGCTLKVPRRLLSEHASSCPEVQVDCPYETFGCSVQDKRGKIKLHEDEAASSHHMLLVLRSNGHLEEQVEVLQEEALRRQQEVHADRLLLAGLQKNIRPLLQQSSDHERIIAAAQRTLIRQEDALSTVRLDVQQASHGLGPGLEELEELRKSLDAVIQEVSAAEALREHLGTLEENMQHHSHLLDLHSAQLGSNKQRLAELEATSYDGKLIWKIKDYRSRRDAEVRDQSPCLSSVPFYTGHCGYKMASKVYLNGDGEGRGTHLSLYVVLMPGDFDALLPWPFRQSVALSVLDQSGAGNHRSLSFRPDPTSKSFQRPDAEALSNVAVGFSRFIALDKLETPQNAAYVRDDTLFVKVKVDMAGLEPL